MYSSKCRTKNGALKNSSINWIFLWRISIQNHPKPSSNTEKIRNKAKFLTWNSIRLKFVKKTSVLNLFEFSTIASYFNILSSYNHWSLRQLYMVTTTVTKGMPNSVKTLGYIKCHSSSPRPVKSPNNSIRYNCEKICSWSEDLKPYWKSEKRPHFSRW